MESRLQKTEKGFRVPIKGNFWDNKARKYNAIPGLLFADDLAILARNWKEMDEQLKVASEVGEELEIKFNPKKSAVVIYCDCGIGSARIPKIQEKPMPIVNEYKYLGVLISNGDNILASQEKTWSKEAEKATNQLHAQTIWGFDKFETTMVQWKAVAVPKLTYGNAVLTQSKRLSLVLERKQKDAGKWALGIPNTNVAGEFIEGEMAWSSFEAREAQSKIRFFHRVLDMEINRWPRQLADMMIQHKIETSWLKRVRHLEKKV